MSRHFTEKETQVANKHMKRYSNLLLRKSKIKTVICHFILINHEIDKNLKVLTKIECKRNY